MKRTLSLTATLLLAPLAAVHGDEKPAEVVPAIAASAVSNSTPKAEPGHQLSTRLYQLDTRKLKTAVERALGKTVEERVAELMAAELEKARQAGRLAGGSFHVPQPYSGHLQKLLSIEHHPSSVSASSASLTQLFYNDRNGLLYVRATEVKLNAIATLLERESLLVRNADVQPAGADSKPCSTD